MPINKKELLEVAQNMNITDLADKYGKSEEYMYRYLETYGFIKPFGGKELYYKIDYFNKFLLLWFRRHQFGRVSISQLVGMAEFVGYLYPNKNNCRKIGTLLSSYMRQDYIYRKRKICKEVNLQGKAVYYMERI